MTQTPHWSLASTAGLLFRMTPLLLFTVAACSTDSARPTEAVSDDPQGVQTGLPIDSTRNQPPGAVAGIQITPTAVTLTLHEATTASVLPVDARRIPSLAMLAGTPVWSTANSAVATVGANGTVRANGVGSTKFYADWAGYRDSATVTVLAPRDSTTNGGNGGGTGDSTQTPPPGPVASFNLSAYVFARATPTTARDTANVVQLSGATVSVYKLSGDPNVTRNAGDPPIARVLVRTVTADGSGRATIANLSSGYYEIVATGSYGGSEHEGQISFGPPRTSEFAVAVYTTRK